MDVPDPYIFYYAEAAIKIKLRTKSIHNKKAVLSQRKLRDAPCIGYGYPEKIRESLATPTATFPEIVNGLLL